MKILADVFPEGKKAALTMSYDDGRDYDKRLVEIFNNHFGGIYYAYVRGCGVGTGNGIYAHTWESYTALENAFNRIKGIIKENRNG